MFKQNGYEYQYSLVEKMLNGCDFAEAAPRLGLRPPVDGIVSVPFMGREFFVKATEVVAADGLPSDPNIRSLLVYYLISPGSGEPAYTYSLLQNFLPKSMSSRIISSNWFANPVVKIYGNDHEKLNEILMNLGATPLETVSTLEHNWLYAPLPKVPVRLLLIESDDEYPTEFKIFLDDGAERFLTFEQLGALSGCITRCLAELGRQ